MALARPAAARARVLALVVTILAALAVLAPAAAFAAPTEPTMSLTDLQTRLTADGRVPGYFKTVMKGSDITTIPVDIVSITAGANYAMTGQPPQLIMFEATGTAISDVGGIAEGMSGSPIYVDDGGVDKLVGAVSYGDIFTLRNTGLATPIDYMSAIESVYPVQVQTLSLTTPVTVEGRKLARVQLSPTVDAARTAVHAADTLVAAPLTSLRVSGIPQTSPVFKSWAAHLAKRGLSLQASPLGAGYDPSFQTDFTGGAAIAALGSRGDMWFGGAGTVTYATADSVVAFGHPLFWTGTSGLTITNAWVDGVWPSTYTPYKMIDPTAPRGTLTQDRSAGIAGDITQLPVETTVTSHAFLADDGVSHTAASYIPKFVADSGSMDFIGLPAIAALVGPYAVEDAYAIAGSAYATTTIVVSDGTKNYTYRRADLYDSPDDIASAVGADAFNAVYSLQSLNAPDISKAHLVSVDLDTTMTRARRGATIVDVTLPSGLRAGTNVVRTTLRLRSGARQTVDTSLYIPSGTSLFGYLTVTGPSFDDEAMGEGYFGFFDGTDPAETDQRVPDVLAQLNAAPKNTDLAIVYHPEGPMGPGNAIAARGHTTSFIRGGVGKTTTQIRLNRTSAAVAYGGAATISGMLEGAPVGARVTIYRRSGSTDTTVATVATSSSYGWGGFAKVLSGLTTNGTYIVRYAGDAETLGSMAVFTVTATPRFTIGASPLAARYGTAAKLSANLSPRQPSGTVTFQYLAGRTWRTIKSVALSNSTGVSTAWQPPRGIYQVRAVFSGSTINRGSTTGVIRTNRY